jgi:lipopolysaccharide transport system ATP-binding protein
MADLAISVRSLGKEYALGMTLGDFRSRQRRLTRRLRSRHEADAEPTDRFWAVKDVSFDVKEGEVMGIIGRNGAGKSTLLKMLARVTSPTTGVADIHGRVGSLLEVGTGFHPELSGRDNIFLSGALLGMKKSEIMRKFDEIVAFSEIERFIDTPVKRYSSGMYVRLAFAVAAHLEPEVLLVDEVLAVGDAGFQKKCLGKMSSVGREGRTVLFVSHNMGAISELCTRAILLDQGRVALDGSISETLEGYARLVNTGEGRQELADDPTLPCSILSVHLENGNGETTNSFDLGDEISLSVTYRVREVVSGLQIAATYSRNMVDVFSTFDTDALPGVGRREAGLYEARFTLPPMSIKAGTYSIRLASGTPEALFQDIEGAVTFDVEERTVNTHLRGYRRERAGHVIAPGLWATHVVDPQQRATDAISV